MRPAEKWAKEISALAPAGFYIALRVGFAFPARELNTFSSDWTTIYTQNGFLTKDPMIKWAYRNSGAARSSSLESKDEYGVLKLAKSFGLNYGAVISISAKDAGGQKSFAILYRRDREFTDLEIDSLYETLNTLHVGATLPKLSKAEIEALAWIRDGYRLKEAAHFIGITESAVKARLISAKQKLGARNSTHAASMASDFGLLIS